MLLPVIRLFFSVINFTHIFHEFALVIFFFFFHSCILFSSVKLILYLRLPNSTLVREFLSNPDRKFVRNEGFGS
jgi:hypothetical protein